MKTITKYIFFITFMFLLSDIYGQGTSCNTATAFCTGTSYLFPAGVNAPAAPPAGVPGPMYGCLGSQPNPAWYFMQVGTSGNIEIHMQGTGPFDIDFTCWGPFTSQITPCLLSLTAGTPTPNHHAPGPSPDYPTLNMVDCSYDPSFEEWCYIPNAIAGQYYILLITNFSNQVQNISFSQSNIGVAGAGTTNCAILPPNASNNGPVCEGDTLKFTAGFLPNVNYFWWGPNNWSAFVQNPVIPNATAANSGTYYLQVSVGALPPTPETQTIAVVKPKPNVISTSDTVCFGDTAIITASGANSYVWTPGNFTTATLKLTPAVTSSYSVIGTSSGCKDTANSFIKVNSKPVVTANSDSICPNGSATLIAHGANTYKWNNAIVGDSIKVSPAITTNYKVVGTDINNCVDSVIAGVVVFPKPTIQLTQNTTICMGSQTVLTASGGISYLWNTSPPETTSSILVSPTLPLTTYTVGVTDLNNCSDSASVDVSTIPLPVPTISLVSDTICKGANTVITAGGGTSYHWNTGEITPSISVMPLSTYIYNVTVSTALNNIICSADIAIQQNVINCNVIYVPNSFSPSGYNTVFKPLGEIVITKSYQFAIYNRWGQMLFETRDVNQGWDGRFNGEYVSSGAYIYYLRIDNGYEEPFEKIGTVTVIQ